MLRKKNTTPHYKTFLNIKYTNILALQLHKKTLLVFRTNVVIFSKYKTKKYSDEDLSKD